MKDDQKYETPAGTFKPGDATNQRQGFAYPGISWKTCISALTHVVACLIIICRLICQVLILTSGEIIS